MVAFCCSDAAFVFSLRFNFVFILFCVLLDEGGDSNFSSTFSIWDYLFGTFYMPEGVLPQEYGVDDPLFPTTWHGQMIVPFKQFLDRLQQAPKSKPVA